MQAGSKRETEAVITTRKERKNSSNNKITYAAEAAMLLRSTQMTVEMDRW
jgi:hypothetical protein